MQLPVYPEVNMSKIGQKTTETRGGKDSFVSIIGLQIKTEELVDWLVPVVDSGGKAGRCAKIAQERYEEAAMWAVKALTQTR